MRPFKNGLTRSFVAGINPGKKQKCKMNKQNTFSAESLENIEDEMEKHIKKKGECEG